MNTEINPDFSRVYEAYYAKVLSYAAKLVGRDEADDVTQEVFVKVSRSLKTLAEPSKLSSWIYTITLNTVRDAMRARSSRVDRSSVSPVPAGEGEEAPLAQVPDHTSRTAEEIAVRREMIACYLGYVKQLPPRYYEVYVLNELEDLSGEDIARRLSLSPGTVKMRLHRARARINAELREHCRCYYNERGELMGEPKSR